jgi:hypothetical protein
MTRPCYYGCGNKVDPLSPNTYRRVAGWERKAIAASRKNGSDIVGREPLGEEFACDVCIGRIRRGVAPMQGAML